MRPSTTVSRLLVALAALVPAAELRAQDRQPVRPEGASTAGPYSPGFRVGSLLFTSGQIGVAPGTRTLVPGGIGPETRQTLENVRRVVEAGGTTMDRVVKCTVFLADIAEFAAMNEVYVTFFPRDPPARSTVAVSGIVMSARVEIECIAAMP